MNDRIVHAKEPVLLVGGGRYRKAGLLAARGMTRLTVAADSGADWLVKHDLPVDHVIGDMDSISDEVRSALGSETLTHVAEQVSTDFEKCLARIKAPLVLGAGFMGGRVDHELAAYHTLLAFPGQRVVLMGAEDAVCLAPPELTLNLPRGTRVSLFPMGDVCGRSEGLRWPIEALEFAPGGRIGTSNEAVGPVRLEMEAPKMLLILPLSALVQLVQALALAPVWAR